jgi:hypothetical protein
MLNESTEDQSSNDQLLMEIIDTLHQLTLADDSTNCQICNEQLTAGDEVLCHLQSPAGAVGYDIAQIRCQAHDDSMENLFTLGTDDLLIAGRVGRCSDQITQQSWAVLVAPNLQVVSSAATTTAQTVDAELEENTPTEPLTVAIKNTEAETTHHPQANGDNETNNHQNTTLARWARTTTTVEEAE